MSDYDYAFGTPPYDDPQADVSERIVEDLTAQTLSAFRDLLVERISEDVSYEANENYIAPEGWEDFYADNKESIIESVYDEVYASLVSRLDSE